MTFSRSVTSGRSPLLSCLGLLALALSAGGCNAPTTPGPTRTRAARAEVTAVSVPVPAARAQAAATTSTSLASPPAARAASQPQAVAATVAPRPAPRQQLESAVEVKRFVVATGVADREPLLSTDPLPSDGTAIYAFAELANRVGESENVRVTFERKGGRERVGDVTLPIPASTPRHRTWAFTRFIRTAGVWEAVLWSENGAELSRTSFEVKS